MKRKDYKLYKQPCHLTIKKYFLATVVDDWNKFPASVVNSCSANTLKLSLDCYIKHKMDFNKLSTTFSILAICFLCLCLYLFVFV